MLNKKIVFRADGNSKIGMGHIMRCIALSQMLKNNFEIYFAIQDPDETTSQIIENENINLIILSKTSDYLNDVENFKSLLDGTEIAILDGYNFRETYQRAIKNACRKLIYIDDLVAWHQVADVVINHAGLIKQSDYKSEKYTQFLLGTEYALLRSEFLKTKSKIVLPNNFTKYLINFGGADPTNLTLKVCEYLISRPNNSNSKITAIIGGNYIFMKDLKKLEKKGLEILQNLSAENMVKQIENHQIVICSPSTIAYEVASIGKSILLIQTAENQNKIAQFFEEKNLALFVEKNNFNLFTFMALTFLTTAAKRQKVLNQHLYFDGKSGERIRDFILKL